jgi:hypothetical protein
LRWPKGATTPTKRAAVLWRWKRRTIPIA